MKLIHVILCVGVSYFNLGQCTVCTDLEEAKKKPEQVRELHLNALGLTEFKDSLKNFSNLEVLNLSENFLFILDFKQFNLPNLRSLDISHNPGFNMMEFDGIAEACPKLEELDLSYNTSRFLDPGLAKVNSLTRLDLSNNSFETLPDLDGLNSLSALDVSSNKFENVLWLKNLWGLEDLDISDNRKIRLEHIGYVLTGKSHLNSIKLSPGLASKSGAIPKSFTHLPANELIVQNFVMDNPDRKVCKNDSIRKIVLDGCTLSNGYRFAQWVNGFKNLEEVVFANMDVPEGIENIEGIETLRFDRCNIQLKDALKKLDPKVNIMAEETDIFVDGYAGNAQLAKHSGRVSSISPMSDDMVANRLDPIALPEYQDFTMQPSKPRRIQLEFSSYDIPSEAFLTQEGNVYRGEVELKIAEYTDPIMNAIAGAPMTIRGETNELFSSAGMIDFRAYGESGEELKPNPDKPIMVQFEDLQPSQQTDVFLYDDTTQNWVAVATPQSTDYDKRKQEIIDSLNQLSNEQLRTASLAVISPALALNYKKRRKDPYELSFYHAHSGRFSRNRARMRKTNVTYSVTAEDPTQRWMCKRKSWRLDTLITPEIDSMFKAIKKSQDISSRAMKNGKVRQSSNLYPRIIKDLEIVANPSNDNYQMTFEYQGRKVSLPVYIHIPGNAQRVQAKEKKYYKEYAHLVRKKKREADYYDKYQDALTRAQRKFLIEQQANSIVSWERNRAYQREMLGFPLLGFGMANCDYFSRNKPSQYIAFDENGVDEEGNKIAIPDQIRSIYLNEQVFLASDRKKVGVFNSRVKSIFLFVISSTQIAVINGWNKLRNGLYRAKVKRINIEGMSAGQVRDRLLKE